MTLKPKNGMIMASPRVLLTGDYWHADYRNLIGEMAIPATLTPLDKITAVDTQRFSLIVIAQSRSGQFDQAEIDAIVSENPITPVVMLLGSWCEGERRSDTPVEGVKRVFWHQWQGRFQSFCDQLRNEGISIWHSPATLSDADCVSEQRVGLDQSHVIGVSALNEQTYESLAQGITAIGGKPKWVERVSWVNLAASVSAICIDADSFSPTLEKRISWAQSQVEHVPLIVMMNFPRRQEIEALQRAGVVRVVSKPFELADLQSAIESVIEIDSNGQGTPHQSTRGPSFSRQRNSSKAVK
ncbi:hypothetical protein OAG71_03430 [bacterium]|nr:hypothetical protein [bacterium]